MPGHISAAPIYGLERRRKRFEQFKRCTNVTFGSVADLPAASALQGRHHEARTALQQLLDVSRHRYFSLYDVAIVYAALDDVEGALTSLEHARELALVVVEPAFDALRSEPRFQPDRRAGGQRKSDDVKSRSDKSECILSARAGHDGYPRRSTSGNSN